jgi:HEAT repeat protein
MREDRLPFTSTSLVDGVALYAYNPAVSEAIQALRDADWQVRTAAAMALEEIGPGAIAAVPTLIQTLEHDRREDVRRAAAEALGTIKPTAGEAITALTKALKDPSAYVRWAAARAMNAVTERRMREGQ